MEARPPEAEPRAVILDVDTGIDDMVALLIAATADRKSTPLNSSHSAISYAVFCLEIGRASCRERV